MAVEFSEEQQSTHVAGLPKEPFFVRWLKALKLAKNEREAIVIAVVASALLLASAAWFVLHDTSNYQGPPPQAKDSLEYMKKVEQGLIPAPQP